jgi:hypothetical protein
VLRPARGQRHRLGAQPRHLRRMDPVP